MFAAQIAHTFGDSLSRNESDVFVTLFKGIDLACTESAAESSFVIVICVGTLLSLFMMGALSGPGLNRLIGRDLWFFPLLR